MSTLSGLDLTIRQPGALSGSAVGLVTNSAAVTSDLIWSADALLEAGVALRCLFSPEHGLHAAEADATPVGSSKERALPVHSLYGEVLKPTAEMLSGIDLMMFDIPDVGVRFYTYIWTLSFVIDACAEHGIPLLVLDRPNPVTGLIVAGPDVSPGFEGFEGRKSIPLRHGWTVGEFATWYKETYAQSVDLAIQWMEGWRRDLWFDETGMPWVSPSPAMATLETAVLYPGTCLLEGLNVSEGRGTSHPFEWVGAPWLDGRQLAKDVGALALPGVRYRPLVFRPTLGPFQDQACGGVQAHIVDRRTLDPLRNALVLIAAILRQARNHGVDLWALRAGRHWIDCLWGNADLRLALTNASDPLVVATTWPLSPSAHSQSAWKRHQYDGYASVSNR